jgi:hypothetical protein
MTRREVAAHCATVACTLCALRRPNCNLMLRAFGLKPGFPSSGRALETLQAPLAQPVHGVHDAAIAACHAVALLSCYR